MVEKVDINKLKSHPDNPRFIRDEEFDDLVSEIDAFPDMMDKRPPVVNEDYVILGGDKRWRAAKKLGWREIPVIIAKGWTEKQQQEFMIKDNLHRGQWDYDILANAWKDSELDDWGLILPGFDPEAEDDKETEIDPKTLGSEGTIVFKFEYQKYLNLLAQLQNAQEKLGVESNEEVLEVLLQDYV